MHLDQAAGAGWELYDEAALETLRMACFQGLPY